MRFKFGKSKFERKRSCFKMFVLVLLFSVGNNDAIFQFNPPPRLCVGYWVWISIMSNPGHLSRNYFDMRHIYQDIFNLYHDVKNLINSKNSFKRINLFELLRCFLLIYKAVLLCFYVFLKSEGWGKPKKYLQIHIATGNSSVSADGKGLHKGTCDCEHHNANLAFE